MSRAARVLLRQHSLDALIGEEHSSGQADQAASDDEHFS
jgi:hypothetical protein